MRDRLPVFPDVIRVCRWKWPAVGAAMALAVTALWAPSANAEPVTIHCAYPSEKGFVETMDADGNPLGEVPASKLDDKRGIINKNMKIIGVPAEKPDYWVKARAVAFEYGSSRMPRVVREKGAPSSTVNSGADGGPCAR